MSVLGIGQWGRPSLFFRRQVPGIRYLLVLVIHHWSLVTGYAQEIPLGTWRTHNSYNRIHAIALSASKIYAASSNGIVVVDPADNSLSAITNLDGLSGADITALAFDQDRNQLLVSYADGRVDIVRVNEIIQFSTLKDSPTIPGPKRINHITIRQDLAYLSADYGVVVFDLSLLEVRETWRDLGPAGETLRINESTFLQDSIFLATANGVIAGNIGANLLDFANWKRSDQGNFSSNIKSIATFNGKVYAAIDQAGLYAYESGSWMFANFAEAEFNRLGPAGNLLIIEGTNVWKLSVAGTYTKVESEKIVQPIYATEDNAGKLWVGDGRNGLVSDKTGTFQSYVPNGPTFPGSFRLVHHANKIYSVSGGFTSGFSPSGNTEFVNVFSSGLWSADASLISLDVTGIAFSGPKTYVSTFGSGLQVAENGPSVIYTNSNSPLSTNRVTAIAPTNDGVWVAHYGTAESLHFLGNNNSWLSFSFPVSAAQYPAQLVVDRLGQVWMTLNPSLGGGLIVFKKENNQHVYLTEANGSGALPSRSVYSLTVDRDGQVWAGTASGAAYFPNPAQVFSGNVNSVKPIFSGRFLLRDESVTAIAVDGGNRKWMGTQRGLWLFDPFGEKEIYNFNSANSPLLSDQITDIAIHPVTGEVFIGTDKGIVSYRADATASSPVFEKVKIFPNPVTAEFTGVVSISGLSTDAVVKITDISGKLVWQTYANGGTATWNTRDYTGRRAATGMYLVIAVAQDASESIVGKIAVIN